VANPDKLHAVADGVKRIERGRMTTWQVRTGIATDLDLVGPLWAAVHHRHAEAMPQLAPYVSDDETWRVRRELYEQLLGALPGNTDAIRLYERLGYQPTWLNVSRLKGRN
jgi:hypothetical protein